MPKTAIKLTKIWSEWDFNNLHF